MNYRKTVSIFLFLSFLILIISGIVLYIMPHGRVAYWTNWRFLTLNKDEWSAIHTIYSIIFILLSVCHLFYNFNPLKNYFKTNRKELFASIMLTIMLFTGTLLSTPPFKNIMELGEQIKESWSDNFIAPKIPHGELLPLKKLCKKINIHPNVALKRLKEKNIKMENLNQKIKDIAKNNNIRPVEIYFIITNKKEE